jgi:hydantoinase/carbamoylase family amidase
MTLPMTPTVNLARLRQRLETLAAVGGDPADAVPVGAGPSGGRGRGVSRFPYTEAHAQALRLVAGWMEEAGLRAGCDEFGNLVGQRSGQPGWPAIIAGSHLDSVPHGGMFDGALGVLAGVEVAQALHEVGRPLRHTLAVVGFADEEGYAFSLGTLASRCLVGDIPRTRFAATRGVDGRTLAETLAAFNPGLPRACVPREAGAYLELHIEQGPVLGQSGRRVAAVTAITGMSRTVVTLDGEANHAGTTPMAARRDALVGAAEAVLAVQALAEAAGPPAVGTVGRLIASPGATNIVPGRVQFSIEFRAHDAARLTGLCRQIEADLAAIAARRGLAASIAPWDQKSPVAMDAGVLQAITVAIAEAGHEPFTMTSGAGHDAMILAPHVPAGMIFVPSVGGISHSPKEWTEWEDATLGAEVLLRTVLLLDARGPLPAHTLPSHTLPAGGAPEDMREGLH